MRSSFATGTPVPDRRKYEPLPRFLELVWLGNIDMIRTILTRPGGKRVEGDYPERVLKEVDPATGMNALHIAVGRDNFEITQLLVEAGIEIIPDNEGRMPSLIAAICNVSDKLAEYIYEVEERGP